MRKKIRINRSHAATILGSLTSIALALQVIDFDNFQFTTNNIIKLIIIVIPAIGGYKSELTQNKKKDENSSVDNKDGSQQA